MKIQKAAERLGMSVQAVRVQMRRGILPIGVCLFNESKWTYRVVDEWLEAYLQGRPVSIPANLTEREEEYEKEKETDHRGHSSRGSVGRVGRNDGWLRK